MIIMAALLFAAQAGTFADLVPARRAGRRTSAGRYALVISSTSGMTRINYSSAAACIRARDSIVRQLTPGPPPPGVLIGPPSLHALCVPL